MYVCACNGVGDAALAKAIRAAWDKAAPGTIPTSTDVLREAGADGHRCAPKRCTDMIDERIAAARPVDTCVSLAAG